MKNILISFSGGRTSAFMAKAINEHDFYKDWNKLFVFANTGKENEETLEFVYNVSQNFNIPIVWVEAVIPQEKGIGTKYKVVTFENASRAGEPFEQVIRKFGLPSKIYRHCTRDLKEVPIHKYAKNHFESEKYLTAIGIRADEKHRVGKNKSFIYPLVQMNVSESFIREWWSKQDFDLQLKDYQGNCDLCFLKSIRKKLTIIKESPEKAIWWDNMEKTYGKDWRKRFDEHRDLSVSDLINKADTFRNIVKDKTDVRYVQESLFDYDIDIDFDCHCKIG